MVRLTPKVNRTPIGSLIVPVMTQPLTCCSDDRKCPKSCFGASCLQHSAARWLEVYCQRSGLMFSATYICITIIQYVGLLKCFRLYWRCYLDVARAVVSIAAVVADWSWVLSLWMKIEPALVMPPPYNSRYVVLPYMQSTSSPLAVPSTGPLLCCMAA